MRGGWYKMKKERERRTKERKEDGNGTEEG